MRREFTVALLLLLPAPFAAAQQTAPPTPPPGAAAPTSQVHASRCNPSRALQNRWSRLRARVLHSVEAEFSDDARQNRICGTNLIGLTVDANGNPQDLRVIRSLEPSLDDKAIEAVCNTGSNPP